MDTDISGYTEFIKRANKFHFNSALTETIRGNSGLFLSAYELNKSMKPDTQDVSKLDKAGRQELLEDICRKLFDLVLSSSDGNKIFESYIDFCPIYLDFYGEEIKEYLRSEGVDAAEVADYMNLQVYYSVFETCLFSLLCAYIEHTKRIESLTLSEFVYVINDKLLSIESAGYVDLVNSRNRKRERGLSSRYNSDVENLKQWRIRTLSKNKNFKNRGKWKTVPVSVAREFSIVHSVVFGSGNDFKYHRLGSLNKLYSKIREAHKSSKDAEYKDRINIACDNALTKIKSVKYENYLRQCKFFLNEISKNEQFRGITLYKFEMAHSLFNITTEVNSLLKSTTEAEVDSILEGSYILNNIHFPSLYSAFCLIDDSDDMFHCVATYKLLLAEFISSGILILDELVEKGYFGNEDNWYDFFLEIINKMAERILYSSVDIDFSIERRSQICFETILSVPVLVYYEDNGGENNE